jgi:5-bromo-4-chloroindolyl phosphate hydrolysis protein
MLAQADHSIVAIEQASRDIRQPELDGRLRRIAELARAILNQLEDDPRNLRRARKFLNVYLDGVQGVVEDYAKIHNRIAAPALDERFRHALITVESVFREQQQILLESDVDQLDVKIEVLTQQLKREGII